MQTRLLTTTVLALGLMLPGAAMAQSSSGSSESNKPMMNSPSTGGTSGTTGSSMPGAADTTTGTTGTSGATTGTTGATTMSSIDKTAVGKTLYGADDQEVGEIDDVVMSQSGSGVESVLVDVGGFLGLGSKTIAVPVDDIQMQGDRLVASSLTKDQAEQMPEHKQ